MLIVWCKVRKYDKYFVPLHLLFKQVDNPRGRCVLRSGNNTNSNYGFVYCNANNDASNSNANNGSRLTSKIHLSLTMLNLLALGNSNEFDSPRLLAGFGGRLFNIVPIHQCRVH